MKAQSACQRAALPTCICTYGSIHLIDPSTPKKLAKYTPYTAQRIDRTAGRFDWPDFFPDCPSFQDSQAEKSSLIAPAATTNAGLLRKLGRRSQSFCL
jgi:hypothetical protein